jgi:hypothetical protein
MTCSCCCSILATGAEPGGRPSVRFPDAAVPTCEKAMLEHMRTKGGAVRDELTKLKKLDGELENKLIDTIKAFKAGWKH